MTSNDPASDPANSNDPANDPANSSDPASDPANSSGPASDPANMAEPGWRPFTVPNLISVIRLACLPLFVWVLFGLEDRWAAALLLGALATTDWIDGYIARRFNQESELGKILDPTADRLLLLVAVISMIFDGSLPLVIAVLALIREGGVAIAALVLGALGARKLDVTWWGKTGTLLLMFAVPSFLAGASQIGVADVFNVLAWIFVLLGLPIHYYSALSYIPAATEALRSRQRSGELPRENPNKPSAPLR